ncbi:PEPxxWA-CTERM sorting domain-containing protein [Sphingosinicellaceae bacterium]|nr:PEPxxWA-CTERM sorting domain-containing protein [Sphingosinicellaceae bacterium]
MCDGAQVCFGDPRNSGGITGRSAFRAPTANLEPVIGQACGIASISFSVVPSDSPLPTTPPVLPPVVYALPEPSTWAMLIVGFGLSGAVMRRRQVGSLRLA